MSEVGPVRAGPLPVGADAGAPVDPAVAHPRVARRDLDLVLRTVGFLLVVLLALGSALFEAFLSALYWGDVRLPVSMVAALLLNLGLVHFAVEVTGRRLAAVAPALVWFGVMLAASGRTTEGDLVLTGDNWVGIGTMIVGSLSFAVAGYRLILAGGPPRRSGPAPPG